MKKSFNISDFIIAILALVLMASFYMPQTSQIHAQQNEHILNILSNLKIENARLNELVLMGRTSVLQDDTLIEVKRQIQRLQHELGTLNNMLEPLERQELEGLLAILSTTMAEKVTLIERYKGEMAIFRNLQRYLPSVIAAAQPYLNPHFRSALYDLTANIYIYIAMPSASLKLHIEETITKMKVGKLSNAENKQLENILVRFRMLMDKVLLISILSQEVLAQPITQSIHDIKGFQHRRYSGNLDQVKSFRSILALFMVFLLAYIAWSMRKTRQSAERLEEALQELEYQKFALDQHSIVAVTDRSGDITHANDQFCKISQYSEEELVGQNHRIVNSGYHPKSFFKDMWKSINAGKIWHGEVCNKKKDGTFYWVETTIVPYKNSKQEIERYIAIRSDITDQKQAELALKNSEERTRQVLDTALDGMIMLDLNGQVTYWNLQAENIFGWKSQEMLEGSGFDRIISPEQMMTLQKQQGSTLLNNRIEITARHRDGHDIPIEMSLIMVKTDGDFDYYSIFVRDISERLQNERELEETRDQALEASRMKSMFLSTVSHEIRTPMNGIIGMSDLLLDTPMNSEQREFADTIRSSSEALLTIINDILDFSKVEAGKMDIESIEFSPLSVIEGATSTVAHKIGDKAVSILSFIDPMIPPVLMGDPGRLRQVILNLADNAVKFTHEGHVCIQVECDHKTDGEVRLKFSISDTGIGLSEDAQQRLFQPFVQADGSTTRKYGGTGLGLAICKNIVELMGGSIQLESKVDHGSIFSFELSFPIASDIAPTMPLIAIDDLAGIKVLVVDDDATARDIFSRYLNAWHMHVDVASGVDEAMNQLLKQAADDPYDIMIVDLKMPEKDGMDLAKYVQENEALKSIPMILCTAYDFVGLKQHAQEMGFVSLLTKPVRMSQFYDRIAVAMNLKAQEQPAVVVEEETLNLQAPNQLDAMREGRLILLAEDNEVNQRVAQMHLQKLGYVVHTVSDGQEALNTFETAPYAMILMDCQMPVMDGLEATQAIRKREQEYDGQKYIPIVAMTANAMKGDKDRCLSVGMDDYISKPISRKKLKNVLDQWLQHEIIQSVQDIEKAIRQTDQPSPCINLEYIRDLIGDDHETIIQLITLFCDSMQDIMIDKMGAAFDAQDAKQMYAHAHELKGAASNIGGDRIAAICLNMEKNAELENWTQLELDMGQLKQTMTEAYQICDRLKEENNG